MKSPATVHGMLDLRALLEGLARAEVVVAGDFMADEYVFGETERVSREAPVLVVRFERSELRPGGAGNAALNLAALGARVRAVGVAGDDALGERLSAQLREAGVDVAGLQQVRGRATECKMRILAGARSTRRQQMLRVDRAPREPLAPAVQARLARELQRAARGAGAALLSDYGSGVACPPVLEALRRLRRGGLPVVGDSRYGIRALAGFTTVKPNELELEAATGVHLAGAAEVDRAARALQRRLGCDEVLVTRGRHGLALYRRGQPPLHLPAHGGLEAVDVTGAGDTVGAAYAACLAVGAGSLAAARVANVAGALVVRKPGTATVGREELLAELGRG